MASSVIKDQALFFGKLREGATNTQGQGGAIPCWEKMGTGSAHNTPKMGISNLKKNDFFCKH